MLPGSEGSNCALSSSKTQWNLIAWYSSSKQEVENIRITGDSRSTSVFTSNKADSTSALSWFTKDIFAQREHSFTGTTSQGCGRVPITTGFQDAIGQGDKSFHPCSPSHRRLDQVIFQCPYQSGLIYDSMTWCKTLVIYQYLLLLINWLLVIMSALLFNSPWACVITSYLTSGASWCLWGHRSKWWIGHRIFLTTFMPYLCKSGEGTESSYPYHSCFHTIVCCQPSNADYLTSLLQHMPFSLLRTWL